jgi:hypothetical protein
MQAHELVHREEPKTRQIAKSIMSVYGLGAREIIDNRELLPEHTSTTSFNLRFIDLASERELPARAEAYYSRGDGTK